jgi:hypothetical protein
MGIVASHTRREARMSDKAMEREDVTRLVVERLNGSRRHSLDARTTRAGAP